MVLHVWQQVFIDKRCSDYGCQQRMSGCESNCILVDKQHIFKVSLITLEAPLHGDWAFEAELVVWPNWQQLIFFRFDEKALLFLLAIAHTMVIISMWYFKEETTLIFQGNNTCLFFCVLSGVKHMDIIFEWELENKGRCVQSSMVSSVSILLSVLTTIISHQKMLLLLSVQTYNQPAPLFLVSLCHVNRSEEHDNLAGPQHPDIPLFFFWSIHWSFVFCGSLACGCFDALCQRSAQRNEWHPHRVTSQLSVFRQC